MSVKMRIEVEKKIVLQAAKSLIEAGFAISIDNGDNDGEDFELAHSIDLEAIEREMYQTDEEHFYVAKANDGKIIGWVYLVYGNDGWDVISDYTTNLESIIGEGTETQKISDHYAS